MATTSYGSPYVSGSDLVAAWPAASLTVANAIDAAGYYIGRGINAQTASYTGVLTDAGKTVTMTNAGATTFTVPADASVAYPTGTRINILNLGAGACTPTAGAGVTISGTITALATNGSASVIKTATDTWFYIPSGGGGLTFITSGTVSAGSALSINNCFSATYLNYKVILTTNVPITFRLRVGGTDNSSSNYVIQFVVGSSTSVTGGRSAAGTSWDLGGAGSVEFDLFSPFAAVASVGLGAGAQGGATATISNFNLHHNVASSFDGFSMLGTTMTGTAKVYGYQN